MIDIPRILDRLLDESNTVRRSFVGWPPNESIEAWPGFMRERVIKTLREELKKQGVKID